MSIATHYAGRAIAAGARADVVRPALAAHFLERLRDPLVRLGAADVAIHDYVIQRATEVALLFPQNHAQARSSQEECGLRWMIGFVEWYRTAPVGTRDDIHSQRLDSELSCDGALARAREKWPGIDWSAASIRLPESLWWAGSISAADLDRIEGFVNRCRVQDWQVVHGAYGYVAMPGTVTTSGRRITLGWEVVNDWILPPDASHGVGLLTVKHMLDEIDKYRSVGHSLQSGVRPNTLGYTHVSGRKEHIIAIGKTTGDVVTCYRTGR